MGLSIERGQGWHRATLNAGDNQNKLTPEIVEGLWAALLACEADCAARAFLIEGSGGYFSNGMDLVAAAEGGGAGDGTGGPGGRRFMDLLQRLTTSSVVVISIVDGKASGGGVGLAAASDFVFATPRSQFSLPEILWGLLPCVVAPFLIRRVGVQVCQRLTLSSLPIDAVAAHAAGLVDSTDERALAQLLQRLRMVAPEAIGKAKRYLNGLWIINEPMRNYALQELDSLLAAPEVRQRLTDFAQHQRYPWEAQGGAGGKA
ncbi:enoyl-CoA hydratase-related protein [Pseudoduganella buxea]|nr:enoyl-CoA hydratase-related protein [Pseudoduganella buxea]GGB95755.1 methylglutaconyl-CoA hydratase [Pseudoduganella buxea]